MLRDLNTILPVPPNRLKFDPGDFFQNLANGGAGFPFELRVAASRKGEGIRFMDGDSEFHGADVITKDAAYNCKLTWHALAADLQNNDKRANMIKGILKAKSEGVPYYFVTGKKARAQQEINDLRKALNRLNHDLPNGIKFNVSDIIFEEVK